ncbi:hypothetical protein [Falsihalocynthiibacter arcticus]|uniref:hypothetical protein n=1 Tax=Falsihalocynthiibacter arcticus TaxID=1579316 RepID=UPI000A6DEEF4|nr:hypothetical protein [Falsihalocynthiibacter arcticus]
MPIRELRVEEESLSSRVSFRQTVSVLALGSVLVTGLCVPTISAADAVGSNRAATAKIPGSETLPYLTGTVPEAAGTIPYLTGTVPEAAGTIPYLTGTVPEAAGTIPYLTGTVPEAAGTIPYLTGTVPD